MPTFIGTILSPIINGVRNSAAENKGKLAWSFSQIQDPVASIIGKDNLTKKGICEMLSAKWIECHANGNDLSTWLKGSGKEIDPSKIRQLMQLFIVGSEMNPGAMTGNVQGHINANQTEATKRWLKAKGILQRKAIVPVQFLHGAQNVPNVNTGARNGGNRGAHAQSLAQDIANDLKNGTGSYRTIGIWGPHAGHAMAAWVGDDATFFDPNFGEFWFKSRDDFIAWFPTFFKKSGYSMPVLGLCESYEVMDFAKQA